MSSEVETYPQDVRATPPSPPQSEEPVAEYDAQGDDEAEFEESDAYDQYRSLSVAAVTALIFGALSALMLPVFIIAGVLLIVPLMGTLLGVFAVWTVVSRPEEFTGKRLAVAGLGLSAAMLVTGGVLNYQLNKIEVPAEYVGKEVYFWELQPEEDIDFQYLLRMRGRNAELPLPERATELDGKKVFITGYVYPGERRYGLDKFVMVPDKGTCCFGGQPKLTDMIEVKLAEPLRVDYSMWRRGVGGTLRVHKRLQSRDQLTGVIYQLEADYLSEGPGVTGSAPGG